MSSSKIKFPGVSIKNEPKLSLNGKSTYERGMKIYGGGAIVLQTIQKALQKDIEMINKDSIANYATNLLGMCTQWGYLLFLTWLIRIAFLS